MPTLFDDATHQQIISRIESLRVDSPRQWGKMSSAQMLEHASRALEMAIGTKPRQQAMLGKLIGWIFRKDFLGEKPFPKNSPTAPDFIIPNEPNFSDVRERAKSLVKQFHELGERGCDGHIHGFFGPLTGTEWGETQYKHLDHHLRQFGA